MKTALLRVASLAMFVTLAAGCATSRSTIDVQQATSSVTAAKGFATIVEVNDKRRFDPAPKEPSTPSLQSVEELKNPAITSRAIARKRNGYGMALGDVLLPEGRTVQSVTRDAVARALTEQGYEVVDEKSPNFSRAVPVKVDIEQFWAWFTPGFVQVSLEFRGLLVVRAEPVTGKADDAVPGYAIVKGAMATDSTWREVIVAGVDNLVKGLRASIKPAGG
jgi:uncharacterized lipoprotein YajG